jgi:tRNA (cytidine/uridine-2'-O-)-methyltransferase
MAERLNVVLYQPEIPQNTGNIARTCVAAEAKLWLVRPLAFRLDDRRMKRAGLDYWSHLKWQIIDSWDEFLTAHSNRRKWFFTKAGSRTYTEVDFQPDDFLVFGNETNGLPDSTHARYRDVLVRIPTSSHVRSLNLSNAVAIAVFEALRQLTHQTDSARLT